MEVNGKYELLEKDEETGLFRIRALRDIPEAGVKAGDLGGFVGSEGNLSQEGGAWVYRYARVSDCARVSGYAQVYGDARVSDVARVHGDAQVYGDAQVLGDARVSCHAQIPGGALIRKTGDFLCVGPIGSRLGYTTFYRTEDGGTCVSCECFHGTADEFAANVEETHKDNPVYLAEYRAAREARGGGGWKRCGRR
jgi:hypothetical protein